MATEKWTHPLKRIRRHLGMTQEALAGRLRTSRRTIVRWERGYAEPLREHRAALLRDLNDAPHELLRPLADTLGVPLDPLAGDGGMRAVKASLDAWLHAAAEQSDVPARALRYALTAVLTRAAELGLSLEQTRAALALVAP